MEVSFYQFDGFPAVGLLPGIRNNGQALLVPFTGGMVNTQGKTIKPAVIWKNGFSVFWRE